MSSGIEKDFEPLTSQLGVPGTSYRIQLGLINGKWASRLLKGNDVIDSYVYKDEDVSEGGFPNQNLIVGWVLRTVAIPNINPHQVMKTTQALVKQAIQKRQERKVVAPVSETRKIELKQVPEDAIKRPQTTGWVKEEPPQRSDDLKREAFRQRVAEKQETTTTTASGSKTISTTRRLPSIPSGDQKVESSKFCPSCGKDLDWRFCPYCGKPLPP